VILASVSPTLYSHPKLFSSKNKTKQKKERKKEKKNKQTNNHACIPESLSSVGSDLMAEGFGVGGDGCLLISVYGDRGDIEGQENGGKREKKCKPHRKLFLHLIIFLEVSANACTLNHFHFLFPFLFHSLSFLLRKCNV